MDEYRQFILKLYAADEETYLCQYEAASQEYSNLLRKFPNNVELACGLCRKKFDAALPRVRISIYHGALIIEDAYYHSIPDCQDLPAICDACCLALESFFNSLPPRVSDEVARQLLLCVEIIPPEILIIIAQYAFERGHKCPCIMCTVD